MKRKELDTKNNIHYCTYKEFGILAGYQTFNTFDEMIDAIYFQDVNNADFSYYPINDILFDAVEIDENTEYWLVRDDNNCEYLLEQTWLNAYEKRIIYTIQDCIILLEKDCLNSKRIVRQKLQSIINKFQKERGKSLCITIKNN